MNIYELLNKLNIHYEEEYHKAAYTVDDINNMNINLDGVGVKNLFLHDSKYNYFLVLVKDDKKVNLKELATKLEVKHLSFASVERLHDVLGLEKGSVTPMGIINDKDNLVHIIIDKDLINKKLLVHPNRNDRTISLEYNDLINFIEYLNHKYTLLIIS